MTSTFDLYTHKTKFYHFLVWFSIISLIILGSAALFNFQPDWPNYIQIPMEVLIVISSLIMLFSFLTIAFGALKTYSKDGEMTITDEQLVIDSTIIPISTGQITFKLRPRTPRSGLRLTGNKVEVISAEGKNYSRLFVINSYDHNSEFERILNNWSEKGIKYNLAYTRF